MFVWHFEKYTFFKGEVYSYMKVGALDFYLLFKLDMLVIIWVHYTALLSNDFNMNLFLQKRLLCQEYVISKRKLNFESMTHTKSANVVVTINTICSFMKKTLICPIHIWFNPQWSLKNTLVPMSGVQLLKFRGSQLKSTKANIWFCFIFQVKTIQDTRLQS